VSGRQARASATWRGDRHITSTGQSRRQVARKRPKLHRLDLFLGGEAKGKQVPPSMVLVDHLPRMFVVR